MLQLQMNTVNYDGRGRVKEMDLQKQVPLTMVVGVGPEGIGFSSSHLLLV